MMQIDAYVAARHKNRRKRRAYLVGITGFAAAYLMVVAVGWFVFRSPFFRVHSIVVTGNRTVASENVIALLEAQALADHGFLKAALGFDNLLAWPKSVSPNELMLIPQLASVAVGKDYFSNTLTATVTERDPVGVWCFMPRSADESVIGSKRCYWFNDQGIIFERAFDTEGGLFFSVTDRSQAPTGLNLKILPERFAANMMSILGVLRKSGLSIDAVTLDDLAREEISVATAKGPALYFSLRFPADNYLPVIKSLMGQPGFSKLQYIDCRTENRAYYK